MFAWATMESIEHHAKNNPVIVAGADIPNGAIFTLNTAGDTTAAPTASGALYVAINTPFGDDRYLDPYTIPKGARVNAYELAAFEGKEMIATEDNITTALSGVAVGDTLKADANYKLSKTGTAGAVTFKVTEKLKNGVRVQVVVPKAA